MPVTTIRAGLYSTFVGGDHGRLDILASDPIGVAVRFTPQDVNVVQNQLDRAIWTRFA
jgi:hypothetical protein